MSSEEQSNLNRGALIMVVDDNPEFLSGIELTLQMEGFRVWTATDGQQALDELEAAFTGQDEKGSGLERLPDLILADIMMPVMDGYDFYDRVRANPYTNHIPVIFLTAKSSGEDIRHGKELGADDYLTKPFSTEDLLASIRGKLRRAEQKRKLAIEFSGDPTTGLSGGFIIAIAIVGALLVLAFCLGALLPLPW